MENLQELTKKARSLEAAGQDASAVELYLRVLSSGSEDDDPNLLARVGLIQLRLGRHEEAAAMLSRASDAYEQMGMRNISLALSHRVVRSDPSRLDALRKVAELSAALGYRDDARRAALQLADHSDSEASVETLRSYLRHFPEDAGAKSRLTEIVGEEHFPEAPPPVVETSFEESTLSVERSEPLSPPIGHGAELLAPPFEGAGDEVGGVGRLEGLEPTSTVPEWDEAPSGPEPLPLLDLAGEIAPAGSEDAETLPVEAPWEEEESEGEPLPLLGADDSWSGYRDTEPESEPTWDLLEELRLRVRNNPGDLTAHTDLIESIGDDDPEALGEALSAAHPAFASAGDFATASDLVSRLAELRPKEGGLLQTWAEYAFRSGDRQRLIGAYLAVARRLEDSGELDASRRVYDRLLKLDPENREALDATGAGKAEASSEYVDFGAMVLDEPEEGSTRFTVVPEFPTGDEQRDFEEILSAFREQITAGIDEGDSTSHYDLGIAFKEMGLWDDAVRQFQRALRAGANTLASLELLGECYVEKGENERASRILHRAVQLPGTPENDLIGVYYWLGRAQEAIGAEVPARQSYARVAAIDPVFRDTPERLERLASG